MRVVRDQESFKENFERAVSEAKSAFGDGTVFIERESHQISRETIANDRIP